VDDQRANQTVRPLKEGKKKKKKEKKNKIAGSSTVEFQS
jgi:hypothetical protein